MLVDINLLPQKKQRNSHLFIAIGLVFVIFILIITAGGFWLNEQLKIEERLKNQLAQIQELRQVREQQNQPAEPAAPTKQYEEIVQTLAAYPLPTVSLMNEISSLLQDKGSVLQFDYSNSSQIHLAAEFYASREVAFFLDRLKSSSFFSNVILNEIETVQLSSGSTNVLPRYHADFQLTIDVSEVQKATQELNGQ
ncbi:hypothetical protein SAMN05877753_105293 [Bacillus oleivorans]|uniref:Type IV pilus assembly protein PilN n=1 Tax=Bacillus oleivorans TaxID=1448271 RepID=A0A285CVH4_9BACI|nr:hypothetical protein [Bacillus oleivorans]SNX71552.1 hypothetical protein SAMN05877753_105293 [Bacillus oleivorans]